MTDPETDPQATGDGETGTWLRRNAQHRVAGLTIGIMTVNPDPGDPAVRLAVSDPATGETARVVLRPGRPAPVLGRVLTAEQIDAQARAAVLLTVRDGAPAVESGIGRVGLLAAAAGTLVVLLLAVWGGYAWWHSRPAPAMTAQAQQQGAVRLTYPVRSLPPRPVSAQVPGIGEVQLELVDVTDDGGRPVAVVVAWVGDEGAQQQVRLARGEPVQVGTVRLTAADVYDRPDAGQDAADVVVTAAG